MILRHIMPGNREIVVFKNVHTFHRDDIIVFSYLTLLVAAIMLQGIIRLRYCITGPACVVHSK